MFTAFGVNKSQGSNPGPAYSLPLKPCPSNLSFSKVSVTSINWTKSFVMVRGKDLPHPRYTYGPTLSPFMCAILFKSYHLCFT